MAINLIARRCSNQNQTCAHITDLRKQFRPGLGMRSNQQLTLTQDGFGDDGTRSASHLTQPNVTTGRINEAINSNNNDNYNKNNKYSISSKPDESMLTLIQEKLRCIQRARKHFAIKFQY